MSTVVANSRLPLPENGALQSTMHGNATVVYKQERVLLNVIGTNIFVDIIPLFTFESNIIISYYTLFLYK